MPTPQPLQPETIVRISVDVPVSVLTEYSEQALARNITVEQLLSDRLGACASYTSVRPLYLDDNQHRAIEKVLGKKAATSDELVFLVRRLASVAVNGATVHVQSPVLERLRTRCFGMTLPDYVRQIAIRALEAEAGLR